MIYFKAIYWLVPMGFLFAAGSDPGSSPGAQSIPAAPKVATTTIPATSEQTSAALPNKPKKLVVSKRVVQKLSSVPNEAEAGKALIGANAGQRAAFEEAKNLIVANQPYVLKFEDEENYGKVSETGKTHTDHTFSEEEVETFRKAVDTLGIYRNQLRTRCSGASPKVLITAFDKYLHSVSLFNRKALPLVADIAESNPTMVLVVNRNVLIDAPVLISRYLQFKKQRFKESMNKFTAADQSMIDALISIAATLKVKISDSDWTKSYPVRESGLEMISMWPRETIFEATEKLSDARETVCIVDLNLPKATQAAKSEPDSGSAE